MSLGDKGRLGVAFTAICFALLVVAPPASALTRYASPDPGAATGGPCTDPTPPRCYVSAAVDAAFGDPASDEVILAPGTYPNLSNAEALTVGPGDTVHGTPGPAAVIPTSAKFPFVLQPGSALRDVSIIRGGCSPAPCDGPALSLNGALAERVYVRSDTGDVPACGSGTVGAGTATIRDSVCWSQSAGEGAVEGTTPLGQTGVLVLRNLTAVNTAASSTGVLADGTGAGTSMTIFATNVIAMGDDAGSRGDVTSQENGGATVSVVLDHSNFSDGSGAGDVTSPTTNFNVADLPSFLDAANGDFRQNQDVDSTIDRGTAATVNGFALGALALDGAVRCLGQAPDIGGLEAAGPPCPVPSTGGSPPVLVAPPAGQPPRCKKGRKLKRGKCVRKKKRNKKRK